MAKQLKYWNGRGSWKLHGYNVNVCAYTKKQALELLTKACGGNVSAYELNNWFHECWGNDMQGIKETQTEPAVYAYPDTFSSNPQIKKIV